MLFTTELRQSEVESRKASRELNAKNTTGATLGRSSYPSSDTVISGQRSDTVVTWSVGLHKGSNRSPLKLGFD